MSSFQPEPHVFDPEMTIAKLVAQEARHTSDGTYPMTIECVELGGEFLLEIGRVADQVYAAYYLPESIAERWSERFGFQFIESGWRYFEGEPGIAPFVIGRAEEKVFAEKLGAAVEASFDMLQPDVVKTGRFSKPDYSCPSD